MRGYTLAAVAVAVISASAPAADEKYDLRGPGPTKGQVVANQMKMVIKDAEAVVMVAGQKIPLTMTMTFEGKEEQEALAVDGRRSPRRGRRS